MSRVRRYMAWNGEAMEFGGFSLHATAGTAMPQNCLTKVTEGSPVFEFTGLFDREGKEIWEGGLYQLESLPFQSMMKGPFEVKWGYMDSAAFCLTRKRPDGEMGDGEYSEDLLNKAIAKHLKYVGHVTGWIR